MRRRQGRVGARENCITLYTLSATAEYIIKYNYNIKCLIRVIRFIKKKKKLTI